MHTSEQRARRAATVCAGSRAKVPGSLRGAAALAAWIGLTWLGKAWKLRHGHEGPEGTTAVAEVVPDNEAGGHRTARRATRGDARREMDEGGENPGQSL